MIAVYCSYLINNEEEETLDGEFELETSEKDGFTEESPEKRYFQSVLNLGGKELELKSEGKLEPSQV